MANPRKSNRKSNRKNEPVEHIDAAGTVTVGCRLPSGLTVHVPGHGSLLFKGSNDPRALALADEQGYHGVTSGVSADAWAALEQHYAKAKWLTSGALFAVRKRADAIREAQDRGDHNVGFNPLDPSADLPAGIENAG